MPEKNEKHSQIMHQKLHFFPNWYIFLFFEQLNIFDNLYILLIGIYSFWEINFWNKRHHYSLTVHFFMQWPDMHENSQKTLLNQRTYQKVQSKLTWRYLKKYVPIVYTSNLWKFGEDTKLLIWMITLKFPKNVTKPREI